MLWVGCLLLVAGRWRGAGLAGVAAVALGSAMILAVVTGDPRADVRWSVADYRVGYWLWLGSMAALVLAAFVGRRASLPRRSSETGPNQGLHLTGGAGRLSGSS